MATVADELCQNSAPCRILDIPAGAGFLSDRLREFGHSVVSAEINGKGEHYVFADMNLALPFPDNAFDVVTSLEGIEHVVHASLFLSELCRVTKPGGRIYLSTPNIANCYSRLMFLCTGFFFQFWPTKSRHAADGGEAMDLGHITPLSPLQIEFLAVHFGAPVVQLRGTRMKRRILFPLYVMFLGVGRIWAVRKFRREFRAKSFAAEQRSWYLAVRRRLLSRPALFSRSLLVTLVKKPKE